MPTKPHLPSNFPARDELHQLIVSLTSCHEEMSRSKLRTATQHAAEALATLDSYLDAEVQDLSEESGFRRIFDCGPALYEWLDSKHCIHTDKGLFFLMVGQQVATMPGGLSFRIWVNRFRLVLGSPEAEPIMGSSLRELRKYAIPYMDRFTDVLPDEIKHILQQVFDNPGRERCPP